MRIIKKIYIFVLYIREWSLRYNYFIILFFLFFLCYNTLPEWSGIIYEVSYERKDLCTKNPTDRPGDRTN